MSRIDFGFFQNKPDILVDKKTATRLIDQNKKTTAKNNAFVSSDKAELDKKPSENFGVNSTPFSNEPLYISDSKYQRHYDATTPIPNTTVNKVGKKFDDIMYETTYTPRKIADESLYNIRVTNNPKLSESLLNFTKTLSSRDKEVLMYVKEA